MYLSFLYIYVIYITLLNIIDIFIILNNIINVAKPCWIVKILCYCYTKQSEWHIFCTCFEGILSEMPFLYSRKREIYYYIKKQHRGRKLNFIFNFQPPKFYSIPKILYNVSLLLVILIAVRFQAQHLLRLKL